MMTPQFSVLHWLYTTSAEPSPALLQVVLLIVLAQGRYALLAHLVMLDLLLHWLLLHKLVLANVLYLDGLLALLHILLCSQNLTNGTLGRAHVILIVLERHSQRLALVHESIHGYQSLTGIHVLAEIDETKSLAWFVLLLNEV